MYHPNGGYSWRLGQKYTYYWPAGGPFCRFLPLYTPSPGVPTCLVISPPCFLFWSGRHSRPFGRGVYWSNSGELHYTWATSAQLMFKERWWFLPFNAGMCRYISQIVVSAEIPLVDCRRPVCEIDAICQNKYPMFCLSAVEIHWIGIGSSVGPLHQPQRHITNLPNVPPVVCFLTVFCTSSVLFVNQTPCN